MLKKENIKAIYRLSPLQEGIFFQNQLEVSSTAYFNQLSYRIKGTLDIKRLEESLNILVNRHDVLRSVFIQKTEVPIQVVLKKCPIAFAYQSIQSLENKEAWVKQFKQEDRERSFDMGKEASIRINAIQLGEEEFELLWSFHHILMDGWCIQILIAELQEIYRARLKDSSPNLQPPAPFGRYLDWLDQQTNDEGLNYWSSYLNGVEEATVIPQIKDQTTGRGFLLKELVYQFDETQTQALQQLAAAHQLTMNSLLQTIWGVLLGKYNDSQDVVFGTIVSGRPSAIRDVERIVGLFINAIPVRVNYDWADSFMGLAQRMQEQSIACEPYHHCSLAKVQSNLGLQDSLINHLMVFENYPVAEQIGDMPKEDEELDFDVFGVEFFDHSHYGFDFRFSLKEQLSVSVAYNQLQYPNFILHQLFAHLKNIVTQVLENEEVKIGDIKILGTRESEQLQNGFKASANVELSAQSIAERFAQQAKLFPNKTAVAYKTKSLSYRQLNEQANQLAHHLRTTYQLQADDKVALLAERSERLIVALLAILKAGAAYVPIDTTLPASRMQYLFEQTDCKAVICDPNFKEALPSTMADRICWIDPDSSIQTQSKDNPTLINKPNDLAYILFTSGTSGYPKGVMVEQQNVLSLAANQETIRLDEQTCILQTGALSFDASTFEIWGPLLNGGKVVLLPQFELLQPESLIQTISEQEVNTMWMTSSFCNRIIDESTAVFEQLDNLLVGGEILSPQHIHHLHSTYPSLRIINGYGPTENTTFSLFHLIGDDKRIPIPVGRPLSNRQIYIMDSRQRIQPVGAWGEIYVGGQGVARGYLNDDELTKQKFVVNPFEPSSRLYRTGDIGRMLPDGIIDFKGRKDAQVKLRGYRMELSGIGFQLQQIAGVDAAEVVLQASESGDPMLVAYYISSSNVEEETIRRFLASELPAYMIPTFFVQLPEFPLNSSGKIDRAALPLPQLGTSTQKTVRLEELSEMELEILAAWREVLKNENLGPEDNFFSAGGDSIKSISLIISIKKKTGIKIQVSDAFQHPTVMEMAQFIREKDGSDGVEKLEKAYRLLEEEKAKLLSDSDHTGRLPEALEDIYPMSLIEEGMLYHSLLETNKQTYLVQMHYQLADANLVPERFLQAFRLLVAKHSILRTGFFMSDFDRPMQVVFDTDKVACDIQYEDLSQLPAAEKSERLEALTTAVYEKRYDLTLPRLWWLQLIKTTEEDYEFYFCFHHAILDGWSIVQLKQEWDEIYAELLNNSAFQPTPLKASYRDFVAEQQMYFDDPLIQSWWKTHLEACQRCELPLNKKIDRQGKEHRRFEYALPAPLSAQLLDLAGQFEVGIKDIFQAASYYLFKLTTGQQDVLAGFVTHGRPEMEDAEKIIGCFLNTIPVRYIFSGPINGQTLIKDHAALAAEMKARERLPFQKILEAVGIKRSERNPLYDILYGYLDFVSGEAKEEQGPDLSLADNHAHTNALFEFVVSRRTDHFMLSINHPKGLYSDEDLDRLGGYFQRILDHMANRPEQNLLPEAILGKEELECLEDRGRSTGSLESSAATTLHQLFAEQVATAPEQVAIEWEGEVWTYADLDRYAALLAGKISQQYTLSENALVGLFLETTPWYFASVLACNRLGLTYIPIDPNAATYLHQLIVDDTPLELMVHQNNASPLHALKRCQCPLFDISELGADKPKDYSWPAVANTTLATLRYTQTASRQYKALIFSQKQLLGLLEHPLFKTLQPSDRLLFSSNTNSVAAILPTWMTLLKGATLVLPPKNEKFDLQKLKPTVALLSKEAATQEHFTAAQFAQLRVLLLTTDHLSKEQSAELRQHCPNTRVLQLSGPAELTAPIFTRALEATEQQGFSTNGQAVLILDSERNWLPKGAVGTLYINSVLLAQGYWQSETLSNDYFTDISIGDSKATYFRSAYRGCWLENGDIALVKQTEEENKKTSTVKAASLVDWKDKLEGGEGLITLNPTQRDLYLACSVDPEGKAHRLIYYQNIHQDLAQQDWEQLILQTNQQFPILQASLTFRNSLPYLQLADAPTPQLQFIDLSAEQLETEEQIDQRIRRLTDTTHALDIALSKFYLLKIKEGHYVNVISAHHIIFDGLSATRYFEFQQKALLDPQLQTEKETPSSVHTKKLYELYDQPEVIDYWTKQLEEVEAITAYASTEAGAASVSREMLLNKKQQEKITQYCQNHGISQALFFKGLFAYFIRSYFETNNRFVVREVVGNRNQETQSLIGCYYSVIPLVLEAAYFSQDQQFADYFQELRQQKKQLHNNQYLSVFQLNQLLGDEPIRLYYNFQSFFEVEATDGSTMFLQEIMHYAENEAHFLCGETEKGFRLKLHAPSGLFADENIMERFSQLITQVVDEEVDMGEVSLLLAEELAFYPWQSAHWTPAPYADQSLLHELIEARAATYPDRIAVSFEGQQLSYRQLNEQANQWATYLREQTDIQPDLLIGLMLPRSIEMIIGVLSILKAGAAYVPIDPSFPTSRQEYILNDSALSILICSQKQDTDKGENDHLQKIHIETIQTATAEYPTDNLSIPQQADQLAYIIYTSGSTGKPKGVMVEHRNIVSLLTHEPSCFDFIPTDKWVLFHSLSFDFSVWEIFDPLTQGSELVIVSEDICKSPSAFLEFLRQQEITVLNQVPTMFRHLVEHWEEKGSATLPKLRYVIFGGEALNPRLLQLWQKAMPQLQAVNMYGITETTVHVTFKALDREAVGQGRSNIGNALPNGCTAIISDERKLLPPGVVGEIIVAGAGLTRGYLKREALTEERFVRGLFAADDRWYLSGDLGRYMDNGEIEYLGRKDRQVKIRGYRIEIGEIENSLMDHPDLDSVFVTSMADAQNEQQLAAFYTADSDIKPGSLRSFLAGHLPDYMIPTFWKQVDQFPVTSNGKIDSQKLLQAIQDHSWKSELFVAPSSPVEIKLASIWQQVLGQDKIGVKDNFFEIGGHSLNATQIIARTYKEFDVQLDLRTLFTHPTIEGLASQIDAIKWAQSSMTEGNINLNENEELVI